MSAAGAVTGNAVYSQLEYKGRKFKVSQWTLDAMDMVSTTAFLKAAEMSRMMGGSEKAVAQREVALARSFALGAFAFDAIVAEFGLDNSDDLLAGFLYKLLEPHDATVSIQLAMEMVKGDRNAVVDAVRSANPLNGQQKDKTGLTGQSTPAVPSTEAGNLSGMPGETSSQ